MDQSEKYLQWKTKYTRGIWWKETTPLKKIKKRLTDVRVQTHFSELQNFKESTNI